MSHSSSVASAGSSGPDRSWPSLPAAVASFGAVTHDGWVYVCGGYRGERHAYAAPFVSGALHRLPCTGASAWEELASVDPAQGAPLVAHGRHLYRPGGMAARNAPGTPADLHSKAAVPRFDLDRRVWEDFVPLPMPRSSHEACFVGGDLYVAGGWTLSGAGMSGEWRSDMLRLSVEASSPRWESMPQPFRRRALAVAALGDDVWCLGGIDDEGGPSDAVDIFDTRGGLWRQGPVLPAGPMKGFGCSAIAHGGRMWVSGMKGELYSAGPGDAAWSLAGTLRHPRFFHQLVPVGPGRLLAIAGEDGDGKRADLELLETKAPGALRQEDGPWIAREPGTL